MFLGDCGLWFVNADETTCQLAVKRYEAAEVATTIRAARIQRAESFMCETLLSDRVNEEFDLLAQLSSIGYEVVMFSFAF